MSRRRRWMLYGGLGALAGALLHAPAAAQDTTRTSPRRDTTVTIPIPPQADTIARRDSAARGPAPPARARADSVQAPFTRAPLPPVIGLARAPLAWTRDSILATGAITLADMLERVPGLATFRTGWLGAASAGAYMGDVSRVRVFLDGVELDRGEPRGGPVFDLSRLPLWALDALRIEQTGGEIRVYARSWTVDRTTPYSRVDVATGDQDTDLFRFFFGRRFGNGLGVQGAADQFSTTPDRVGATSSQTSLFARVGWARRNWQADAVLLRQTPRRGLLFDDFGRDSIAGIDLTRTDAYLRAGYGDVDGPLWVQATAAGLGYRFTGVRDPTADSVVVDVDPVSGDSSIRVISADTGHFQAQYVLAAGITRGPFRVTGRHRASVVAGTTFQIPSLRVQFGSPFLAATARAEGRGVDSIARVDGTIRLSPTGFLRVGGRLAARDDGRAGGRAGVDWRAGGAVRLRELWFGGGIASRAATVLPPARLFDSSYVATAGPAAQGAYASVQGRIWGPLQVDLLGEAWRDEGLAYRPRFTTRSEAYVRSNFLGRFPMGNFGLYALLRHEYRSAAYFPARDGDAVVLERTSGFRVLTGLLEIRILDATLTYQFRNLLGTRFETVPGYQMPRQTQFYGVRWTFWN